MPKSPLGSLRISHDAQPLVARALAKVATADRPRVEALLVKAASADLNKYLTAAEVQAVLGLLWERSLAV